MMGYSGGVEEAIARRSIVANVRFQGSGGSSGVGVGVAQLKNLASRIAGMRRLGKQDEEIETELRLCRGEIAKILRKATSLGALEAPPPVTAKLDAAAPASNRPAGVNRKTRLAAPGAPDKDGLRKIAALAYSPPADWRAEAGKEPYLAFLPIADLRVETAYQRVIGKQGAVNIRDIVCNFRWSRFLPIAVAPLSDAGGPAETLYAILDGQHRAAALLTLGVDAVPCVVFEGLDAAGRADAFAAMNINVTALTPQAKFFAMLGAGNPVAAEVASVCRKNGVEILRHNLATHHMTGRQTVSSSALLNVCARWGGTVLSATLSILTAHARFSPAFLKAAFINALARALASDRRLLQARAKCAAAISEIDLAAEYDKALADARGCAGVSATSLLCQRLSGKLALLTGLA